MTRNLKIFIAFCLLWSVAFFSVLNWCLYNPDQRWPLIVAAAVTYGIGFGITGYYFGKRDEQSKVRYDLSWRYSLASTISSFVVGSLWVVFFRPAEWLMLVIYVAIAFVTQLPHWLASRKSVKGISKQELFK